MGKKPAGLSYPSRTVTPDPACTRCQADAATDPCDSCPLCAAWCERLGRPDDAASRTAYASWARAGGWRLRWTLGRLLRRRDARIGVLGLLAAYPRVHPDIVAHHLEVR